MTFTCDSPGRTETLVALTIATTVAFALLRWLPAELLAMRACQDRSDALSVSDAVFSDLEAKSFSGLTVGPLTLAPQTRNGTSFQLQGKVLAVSGFATNQLVEIDLVIAWNTGSISKQMHRVHAVVNPGASS